jgi:hypothetical protein
VPRSLVVVLGVAALLFPGLSSASSLFEKATTRAQATNAVKAFDTTATITDPAWFAGMVRRGFGLYIMHSTWWGTCNPWPYTVPQLKMALDAGLKIAVYTRDPRCWRQGIEATGPYARQLQFFALDIETDPGIQVTQEMVDGVASIGVRPVIYSGSGMWPGIMGPNATSFSNVPLWDTDTSTPPSPDAWAPSLFSPAPVPYGGWNTQSTMRKGIQQAFEVPIDGVHVDLSSFDSSFLQ